MTEPTTTTPINASQLAQITYELMKFGIRVELNTKAARDCFMAACQTKQLRDNAIFETSARFRDGSSTNMKAIAAAQTAVDDLIENYVPWNQVTEIKALLAVNYSRTAIANILGISTSKVNRALKSGFVSDVPYQFIIQTPETSQVTTEQQQLHDELVMAAG